MRKDGCESLTPEWTGQTHGFHLTVQTPAQFAHGAPTGDVCYASALLREAARMHQILQTLNPITLNPYNPCKAMQAMYFKAVLTHALG